MGCTMQQQQQQQQQQQFETKEEGIMKDTLKLFWWYASCIVTQFTCSIVILKTTNGSDVPTTLWLKGHQKIALPLV